MYEMVTGHRMFSATSSYSVMEAHVKEMPRPPMEVQPSVPKGLSDIIMMAVAKDPAQRFQTAEAFRNALSQVGAPAAVAAVAVPQAVVTPSPQPFRQPTMLAPPPAMPPPSSFSPPPQQRYAPPDPRPTKTGGRHVGWIVVAAIVVLVALFGGTQVLCSHKQASATDSAAAPSANTQPSAPAATPTAPSTAQPAQPRRRRSRLQQLPLRHFRLRRRHPVGTHGRELSRRA